MIQFRSFRKAHISCPGLAGDAPGRSKSIEDERRLFYVAITRAKERLVFLGESKRDEASPFSENFQI
jgi:superfamily I DNA/RNA helicase